MNNVKYIINNSFKVIFKGEFSAASEVDGEFTYITGQADEHALATILEIASANGLKISSKAKKAEAIEQLNAHLETLSINEVNKMTDTQIVEEVIEAGMEAGHDDDTMLIEVVNRGVSFKSAGKLFKSVMETKGYRVSAKERAEKAAEIIAGSDFGVEEVTAEDVQALTTRICDEVADTTEKQANAAIRKFAKEKGIELPKKAKGSGRGTGTGGLIKKVGEFMLENRDCDEAAISEFIKGVKEDITDAQLKKYVANATRTLAFAKAWAE